MKKTVTYISSKNEEFNVIVMRDRDNGFLDLQINRAGGKYQRFLKVPKQNVQKKIVKSCWFEKVKTTKSQPSQESKNS